MPPRDKSKQNEYQRNWVANRRKKWFDANGPCVDCDSWSNLELDHIDPKTKIHHSIWSWSQTRRDAELKKCVIRCHDCHAAKTREYQQANKSKSRLVIGGFTSSYIGVSWDTWANKWRADIKVNGKNKNLGRFDSEDKAAQAYEEAKQRYYPQ